MALLGFGQEVKWRSPSSVEMLCERIVRRFGGTQKVALEFVGLTQRLVRDPGCSREAADLILATCRMIEIADRNRRNQVATNQIQGR